MERRRVGAWLRAYYLSTPVFFLLDLGLGIRVRAAFFGSTGLRYAWYGLALACGLASWAWPRLTEPIALTESTANLALVILGIMLPIYAVQDQILAGGPIEAPYTVEEVLNAGLAGLVLVLAIYGRTLRDRP